MSVEELTEVVDFLDENYNPGVTEEDAHFKVTYKLENGEIIDVKTEVLLPEES